MDNNCCDLWYNGTIASKKTSNGSIHFYGIDCCERKQIGNGVCDEVNNFESCWNFDGGDCIMIKSPAIYGKVTAKPSTITEETVSQSILNQIAQKSSMDIEMNGGKDYQNLKITF